MREQDRRRRTRSQRPILDLVDRVGPSLTAAVGVLTALMSVATIYLVLSRPLEVADALVEPRTSLALQALAGLVLAALRDLLGYL